MVSAEPASDGCNAASGYALRTLTAIAFQTKEKADNLLAIKPDSSIYCCQDSPLIRALGLAHYWQRLLDEGKHRSLTEIAAIEGIDLGQASRLARLCSLSPYIVTACLQQKNESTTFEGLVRMARSADWTMQNQTGTG